MASLYETFRAAIVTAVKARETKAVPALRTADAMIQRASLDQSKPIDDALVIATLRKSIKNLADAKAEFEKGGRADLAIANEEEIRLLERFLPKGIDPARLDQLIAEAIRSTGAASRKEMGKVIGALKQLPEAAFIDFAQASKIVQAKLP